ncbi:MAG: cation diffusion facilitator family transporter [Patescibacteria group bacterium]|nr:cation diffusion facilitator family transporter [Patescibacteria group bacterium]
MANNHPTEHNEHPHDHADHDHGHSHDQAHGHNHGEPHGHSHGLVDESIIRSKEGVKAVSLSFAVLFVASMLQLFVYSFSGSIALLTDLIHNGGDALTAIPLGLAFFYKSKKGERWAGYAVVMFIFISALVALYEVINKIIHPSTPTHLWAIMIAGLIGVAGNEIAAVIRWRAGKHLDSPALIADGNHARADGIVSAGVILSAFLIYIGLPIADPIIGFLITAMILQATWQSWQTIRNSK